MTSSFTTLLVQIAAVVLAVASTAWVFNRQRARDITTVQERVIAAQREERTALVNQIERLQREIAYQRDIVATIRKALEDRGLKITISGDYVTIQDRGAPRSATVHIKRVDAVAEVSKRDDDPGLDKEEDE